MKKNVLVFTLYMCAAVMVFAQSEIDFGIWETGGTITITKYKGTVKDVKIPERINGLPVTAIGQQVFQDNRLTNVTIPNSVTTIGMGAFWDNRLTSITIPDSVTAIGKYAFYENQLTSITLPDNVNIQITSFGYCSIYSQFIKNGKKKHTFIISPPTTTNGYEIVTVDNTVVEILKYNGNEKDIRIPERINGLPVVTIGNKAFSQNGLTSVTIPNSVTVIGGEAFISNQLTSVIIPNSAIAIGANAFQSNKLTSITIPSLITFIGENAFRGNQLTSITIPNSATIEDSAFVLNNLTSITIGANVTLGRNSIGGLESTYNDNGKRAVTYTRPDTSTRTWTVQQR